MRKQKQKQGDVFLIFKSVLKVTGDKWISDLCWGRRGGGDTLLVLWRTLDGSRGEGRTGTLTFLTLGLPSTLSSQGPDQAPNKPLCPLQQRKKILQENIFYTNSHHACGRGAAATSPFCSGMQICGDFLQDQCRAVKNSHNEGSVKPLSCIYSCSHAKIKLSHWCPYCGRSSTVLWCTCVLCSVMHLWFMFI